jgi:RecA-family ATPase
MVVLDTLGAVQDPNRGKGNVYRSDYTETIALQKLAQQYSICLLILHHTNKGDSRSPIARASGSHGITGAVDSVLMLSKDEGRSTAELSARPRDGESSEICLERLETGGWSVAYREVVECLGTQHEQSLNKERLEVKQCIEAEPKLLAEIATGLGLSSDTTRKRLERMRSSGQVKKQFDGRYTWAEIPNRQSSWADSLDLSTHLPS